MLLRELRYFATVAERGSVLGAAKALRVAQPALSRQVRHLEGTIGAPLFYRERRGVRLTPAGDALLYQTRRLFDHLDATFRRVYLANEGMAGTLRLGLGRVAIDDSRVGKALAAFREHFPDVALVMTEVPSARQSAQVLARELDVAIGMDLSADVAVQKRVMFEFVVDAAVIAETDPLAGRSTLTISDLRDRRLLVVDPLVAGDLPHLYDALKRAGVTAWEAHESVESVYALVAAGRGWTLGSAAGRNKPPIGTVVVPLDRFSVPMSMVVRSSRGDRSAMTANLISLLVRANDLPSRGASRRQSHAPSPGAPRGLQLRHLKTLTVIAEQGSLTRAARQLGLTQSAVSRQIRGLENELGFSLLERDAKGVAPTAAGNVLRLEAQAILALVEAAVVHVRKRGRGQTGHCRIGVVALEFVGELIIRVLKQLEDSCPEIGIQVNEMLSLQQLEALRERRIDIGIAGANAGIMDDPTLTGVRLVEDTIECALLPVSHELATRAWLKPADLTDVPFLFIARETQPKFYDAVMQAFENIGLTPKIGGAFNGPRTLWQSAADGLGWTIASRSVRAKPLPGLVAIPIEGLSISSGLQLLWRRDERNTAILTVIDAFRDAHTS